ncbi:ABC transporter permease [Dyadobacter aurulentus]|uniref:ABC transporter permease n=1 Tax=Dyadobacter sp. UC 10 TaxID=2605428 RepID=UPI0011F3AC15|nr:ABC transporter permease [Dyadobacter sp. UC 10]KAA0993175.1 FtsX-like permease family protein [Dyadobacter sp. UC 10]
MLQNYFKIAWRNLQRNRAFSAINIAGLAIGLASCMLISLYVIDELSYDRFNEKADQIVRVVFKGTMQGGKFNEAHVMPPTAAALKADYPEVLESTRLRHGGSPVILMNEKLFTDNRLALVDNNFFQVFTLPFLSGNSKTALSDPNAIVISETMARKFFGNTDPVGKLLTFKGFQDKPKIAGVFKDIPRNSHFQFDIFASLANSGEAKSTSWMQSEFFTYLVLPKDYDYKKLEAKLPGTVEKYMGPQVEGAFGMSFKEFRKKGNLLGLYLQPLTDIHLHSDFQYDLGDNGDIRYVYIFGAVATIMLLIACINFMNLSTASSSKRAKEIGVRKVMGSARRELVWQFLTESVLITFLAMVLAILIGVIALPLFNSLSDKELKIDFETIPAIAAYFVLFGLFVGFFAGSYPAFFLSSFRPIAVLKGNISGSLSPGSKGISMRSGLVVFQFAISIVLIIGTMVVYNQLEFIQNKKLGYDKDQVLVLPDAWALGKNQEAFKNELISDSRIAKVSASGYLPAGPSYNNNYSIFPESRSTELVKTLRYDVDYDYISTLGMKLVEGRNFSKSFGTDSSAIIINQTTAKMLGWERNALNHTISSNSNDGKRSTYVIIGVVEDFHFKSFHEQISPLVMILGKGSGTMIAKVKTKDIAGLISSLEKKWNAFKPDLPFTYSFLDDRFDETYKAEQKTAKILGLFAALTIFVACLGLFGLATFTAEQRTKEIGVRKVLGASVPGIVVLLSRDFMKLVGIAMLIAAPMAWWLMNKWLQDFAYKIDVAWWMFVAAGMLSLMVALVTVSFQSVKAALMNPVKSLKSE